jgi:hypothetical protein
VLVLVVRVVVGGGGRRCCFWQAVGGRMCNLLCNGAFFGVGWVGVGDIDFH